MLTNKIMWLVLKWLTVKTSAVCIQVLMLPATHSKSGRTERIKFSSVNLVISIEGNSLNLYLIKRDKFAFLPFREMYVLQNFLFFEEGEGKGLGEYVDQIFVMILDASSACLYRFYLHNAVQTHLLYYNSSLIC